MIGAEMLPYYSVIRKWKFLFVDLGGLSGQIGYGKVRKVFTAPGGVRAGPAICYEAVYGEYFTEFVRNGAQVMCVISNDGWWRDTPGHRYLFAYSRLRAVENRRSIARSANTGISGFIDQIITSIAAARSSSWSPVWSSSGPTWRASYAKSAKPNGIKVNKIPDCQSAVRDFSFCRLTFPALQTGNCKAVRTARSSR